MCLLIVRSNLLFNIKGTKNEKNTNTNIYSNVNTIVGVMRLGSNWYWCGS